MTTTMPMPDSRIVRFDPRGREDFANLTIEGLQRGSGIGRLLIDAALRLYRT